MIVNKRVDTTNFFGNRPFPEKVTMDAIAKYLDSVVNDTGEKGKYLVEAARNALTQSGVERLARLYEERFRKPHLMFGGSRKVDEAGVSMVCDGYFIGFIEAIKHTSDLPEKVRAFRESSTS